MKASADSDPPSLTFLYPQTTAARLRVMAYDLRPRSRGVLQGSARAKWQLGGSCSGGEHRLPRRVYVSSLHTVHEVWSA